MSSVLVDTSVWIDHFRNGNNMLAALLDRCQVKMHPMVRGELACGNLRHREEILTLLNNLPKIPEASHDEALFFLEQNKLMGCGIGFIDLHLLAAVSLTPGTCLWTSDNRLHKAAQQLNICWQPAD